MTFLFYDDVIMDFFSDFNEDDLLDSEDLEVVMERLIGCHDNRSFQPEELEIMTRNVNDVIIIKLLITDHL